MKQTTPQSSDHHLVIRVQAGDTGAFTDLVRRYAKLAYGVARSRVRDRATSSDVVQGAFTLAFERLRQLRTPEHFGAWLRKLVIVECARLAREEQRSTRRADRLAALVDTTESPTGDSEQFDGELGLAAVRLLDTLPPAQREAAEMCLVRGEGRAAAAAFLGVEETTLRKRLHDARRKLQAQVFTLARETLREDQLPAGFAKRCVCQCERSRRKA